MIIQIIGAGKIKVSGENNHLCGGKNGFGFQIDWHKHGTYFVGGILSNEDAVRLAEHILDVTKHRK